jgi:hypothetical protein
MLSRKMPDGHKTEEQIQLYVHSVPALEARGYSTPRSGRFSIGAGLNSFGKPRPHRGSNLGRFIKHYALYVGHTTIATGHNHHICVMYLTVRQHHGLMMIKSKLEAPFGLGEVTRGIRGNCL